MTKHDPLEMHEEISALKIRIKILVHQNDRLRDALVEALPYIKNDRTLKRATELVMESRSSNP